MLNFGLTHLLILLFIRSVRAQDIESNTTLINHEQDGNETHVEYVKDITVDNINTTLLNYEVVFIHFYVDWCPFSKRVKPLFENAAHQLAEEEQNGTKVLLARVNSIHEVQLAKMYNIKKFPTFRLVYRGKPLRQEYRGQRSTQAFVAYVKAQINTPAKRISEPDFFNQTSLSRRTIIGYFYQPEEDLLEFEQLAGHYQNDCDFYAYVGKLPKDHLLPIKHMPAVIFRPDTLRTYAKQYDVFYMAGENKTEYLDKWLLHRCVPMIREVDFHNVEELIEERLPILMLIYYPSDNGALRDFKAIVEMQLQDLRGVFNFITADGFRFEHSVLHMGKKLTDLPIIAIDSLEFMHPLDNYSDIFIPGKLKEFMTDFQNQYMQPTIKLETTSMPLKSTFKELGPSKHRYTLLNHDEL